MVKIQSKNLNFHNTFRPQLTYIVKLLKLANDRFIGGEQEISCITGIPTGKSTGKVLPHLYYGKYMGLIDFKKSEGKYELNLTYEGKKIYEEDRYLIEDSTRLLLHYNILDEEEGAPHWSYLFKEFNSDTDVEYLINDIESQASSYFGKSECKLSVVKKSYEEDCFETLRIINAIEKDKIVFNQVFPKISYLSVYGYTLIKSIEKYFSNQKEISVEKIILDIKWNKAFGLDYDSTLYVLDELESEGYVKLNKQLNPITVIILVESKNILSDLYKY